MKRTLVILAILLAGTVYGQTSCSDDPLFRFDNAGGPMDITSLGHAPEFPFFRNLSTPSQVAAAIRRTERRHGEEADKFNTLMTKIGFANGASDVDVSNISVAYLPDGTEGNMGSGEYNATYAKLDMGDGVKAWKISSSSGSCYLYFLSKCGNAFYPKTDKTACISTPVTITSQPQEITVSNAPLNYDTNRVFVYYHRRKHRRPYTNPAIADDNPSKTVLLSTTSAASEVPQTYQVSVSTPDATVQVCPDSVTDVAANINVEKTSSFTGYYPDKANANYKLVSKRVYRKSARKMRKVERKEARVSYLTGVPVARL